MIKKIIFTFDKCSKKHIVYEKLVIINEIFTYLNIKDSPATYLCVCISTRWTTFLLKLFTLNNYPNGVHIKSFSLIIILRSLFLKYFLNKTLFLDKVLSSRYDCYNLSFLNLFQKFIQYFFGIVKINLLLSFQLRLWTINF